MIRFPTHDGRGGFTLAVSASHPSEKESSIHSRHTALPSQSLRIVSSKANSTHASTSSSILDDALPRQPHPTTDLSQRIHAWAQEQQLYTRLRHKRRRLSAEDQRIHRNGLEGWIWRFVSSLINMDDELLQIVLGEKLIETPEQPSSEATSFWEGFLQRTAMEKSLASPFPSPQFQQMFRQTFEAPPSPSPPAASRPSRQAPTPWDPPRRQLAIPPPTSSWSSLPADPIQTAPFQPSPIRGIQSPKTESSHAAWGIEDNDILSTTTEVPDDYWDREFTIPLVWHLVKNFISRRLPTRERSRSEEGVTSCKKESIHGRWDDPDERGFYWHESVDGASSLGLGLGGLGTWAEV
jgi:hypothetical protein